jgi:hypothetical protein
MNFFLNYNFKLLEPCEYTLIKYVNMPNPFIKIRPSNHFHNKVKRSKKKQEETKSVLLLIHD